MGEKHTDSTLNQPNQRPDIIPPTHIIQHIDLTIVINVRGDAIHLQRCLNKPRQKQHEENKTPDEDYTRHQESVCREDQEEDYKRYAERAGHKHEWE